MRFITYEVITHKVITYDSVLIHRHGGGTRTPYPEDEADGGHSGRGHDLGAVGHEAQQRGHDALRAVVELDPQYR